MARRVLTTCRSSSFLIAFMSSPMTLSDNTNGGTKGSEELLSFCEGLPLPGIFLLFPQTPYRCSLACPTLRDFGALRFQLGLARERQSVFPPGSSSTRSPEVGWACSITKRDCPPTYLSPPHPPRPLGGHNSAAASSVLQKHFPWLPNTPPF